MDEVKKALLISTLISVLGCVVIFLGWDVAVDKYLIPRVEAKLLQDNYLREEIKAGKFVSTNQEAFHKNHIMDAQQLIKLNTKQIVSLDSLDEIDQKIEQLKGQLAQLENQKILSIQKSIEEAQNSVAILQAKDSGKIKLKVYFHKDASQEGTLILNRNNPAVSSLIRNNDTYKVTSVNKNKERYKIRIQDLTVAGKSVTDAIASLYIKDHDELFDSSKSSGIGTAFIALN